jgi:hypothetical protein
VSLLAIAVSCWKAAAGSPGLTAVARERLIAQGLDATDQALLVDHNSLDALTCKTLLLRLQASLQTDAATHAALIEQADGLHHAAIALAKRQQGR